LASREIATNVLRNRRTSEPEPPVTEDGVIPPNPVDEVPVEQATTTVYTVNWDAIASCESGNNWGTNTGNGFYGGLQFAPGTWSGYGGSQFADSAHYTSREQQITPAERVL
jgi:hypothetical protein